jgi:hypothetical protein
MSKQTLRIAGIDWATEGGQRALVGLEVGFDGSRSDGVRLVPMGKSFVATDLDTQDYQRLVHAEPKTKLGGSARTRDTEAFDIVAIDIPFGWPLFASTVVGEQTRVSEMSPKLVETFSTAVRQGVPLDELFSRRYTDEVIRYEAGLPTAKSTDRLALGALALELITPDARARGRLDTLGRPFSGDVTVIEANANATLEVLSLAYTELWEHRSIMTGHGGWLRLRELEPAQRPARLGPWVKFSRGSETQVRKQSRLFYRKKGEDEFVRYALAEWFIDWLKIQDAAAHIEQLSASSESFDAFMTAVTGVLYAARVMSQKLDVRMPPSGKLTVRTPDAGREAEFRRADGSSRDVFGYNRDELAPSTRTDGTWLATEVDVAQREGWVFFPTTG